MEIAASVGLGIALAIDASIVSFSCGLASREHTWTCPLRLALVTGIFQGVMPTLGFFAAGRFVRFIDAWDHWVAFGVFLVLGAMFIRNAWRTTLPQSEFAAKISGSAGRNAEKISGTENSGKNSAENSGESCVCGGNCENCPNRGNAESAGTPEIAGTQNSEKSVPAECGTCAIATWRGVFAVGVATSIDALAVGAGIACANSAGTAAGAAESLAASIFVPAAIIAGTTFLCVWLAFAASRIFRSLPVKLLGTLAGAILILLGIRTVLRS